MNILEIEKKKKGLLIEFNKLSSLKKNLYSDVDVSAPMCQDEKTLTRKLSVIASELNQLVILKRKLK